MINFANMDINQQLELVNLSTDILTENDVLTLLSDDDTKLVTAKGILNAIHSLSDTINVLFLSKKSFQTDISNYYVKQEIDKKINYLSNSLSADFATKHWVEDKRYLSSHQSLSDYYNRTDIETILNNYYNKSQTSSNTELYSSFASLYNQFAKYYSKSETSSANQLNSKFSNYYAKDQVSSANQLNSKFNDIYSKSETSSANQLNSKFNDIYSKSETSSAIQLDAKFNDIYSKSETSSAIQLDAKFSEYNKGVISSILSDLTLSADSTVEHYIELLSTIISIFGGKISN